MNYAITPEGTIVEVGDKAVVKGYEVFSDTESLREAIAANRLAHFKKHNPFAHAKKLYSSLPSQLVMPGKLGGFEHTLTAIAMGTFAYKTKAARASSSAPKTAKARKVSDAIKTSKKSQVIEMLKAGTTREAIAEKMGWLPHTVRGFICTLAKTMTITVTKTETAGGTKCRFYRIGD
jgi:hypothetical protein